jgi:hypothetical protein
MRQFSGEFREKTDHTEPVFRKSRDFIGVFYV